ncbi:MAG: hypothetical protein IIB31_09840, partial [Chloroflexi bacterium]|nr:hypothetical protein [Chloroflexota bacterium]
MVFGSRSRRILFETTSFFLAFTILFSSSSIVAFSVPRNIGQDNIDPNLDPRHVDPNCQLYPIALHSASLDGLSPGDPIQDILSGTRPGNFGWLSWDGKPSASILATSLAQPGNSRNFVNPDESSDHRISVGDQVQGSPGIANSRAVRDALDLLKNVVITVPVWDETTGRGNNTKYQVASFAKVQITDYQLSRENRISVIFQGSAECLPPEARDDSYITDEDRPLAVPAPGVLSNDTGGGNGIGD